ncbi:unnamed protein product [Hapterophycus canaliculatus]
MSRCYHSGELQRPHVLCSARTWVFSTRCIYVDIGYTIHDLCVVPKGWLPSVPYARRIFSRRLLTGMYSFLGGCNGLYSGVRVYSLTSCYRPVGEASEHSRG